MKLVFATHNTGKIQEMRDLLRDMNVEVLSADEAGVPEDVVEDGKTFEQNALKKARFVGERTGQWAVADDSGVCIQALDGAPGVRSARWAGEGASDAELVKYTLAQIADIPEGKRGAYFETALALVSPDGKEWVFHGKMDGKMTTEPHGTPRVKLPYDAIFIPTGEKRTCAEMSLGEKNAISHRGRAFQELKQFLWRENPS